MRAASDVGGTFTDLVYYDFDVKSGECGPIKTAKTDTTPPNFEDGVINAISKANLRYEDLAFFAHGSTVIINTLTERKGAKTALITTKGFRDVLEIARGNRPDLFNFNFRKPKPFVERYLRCELTERVNYKGEVEVEVDLLPLPELLEYLNSEGVEAIAVCFLHAYANFENEKRTVEEIKKLWPQVSVLASHQVSREWREYERTNTAVLSAYVHPVAEKYINSLVEKLKANGFAGRPYMMQSNAGIATVAAAINNPISMVESGPSSGIYAAAYLGNIINEPNLIVIDIGGTTAKCALIENGKINITTDYYIERTAKSPGYPIQTPIAEIVEIGNGGGSIAWVDVGGKLHVGPQSAGAMPGPVAYGRGGDKPTPTDANLLLGRIDQNRFVGGEVEPDMPAVEEAFKALGKELNISMIEAARGVIRIANANMVNALRLVSTNKGYDPRDFALMAFGGGGAMHAVALAEELKIPKVIVPVNSAVFSAWGMLQTDLRRDYVQTNLNFMSDENRETCTRNFSIMREQATRDFMAEGVITTQSDIHFEEFADMRYTGQEHTVKVRLKFGKDGLVEVGTAIEDFHHTHERNFTYRLDTTVEIVNYHLVAKVDVPKPDIATRPVTGRDIKDAVMHQREVDFDQQGVYQTTIYDGLLLEPGMTVSGPAIIEEPATTLVVSPGHTVEIDMYGNYQVNLS